MQNLPYLLIALFISFMISACTPRTPQTSQELAVGAVLETTETPLPSLEDSPSSTMTSLATLTSTQKPTRISETIPSATLMITPSATKTAQPSATLTFEPAEILRGGFYGVDENHLGSGNAVIIQTNVGEYSLYFENFEVTSGPDLHVILAEDNNPYSVATLGDYLDLGKLESTSGNQTYIIPAAVNLEKYGSVVVYCVPFQAIFAIAPIK